MIRENRHLSDWGLVNAAFALRIASRKLPSYSGDFHLRKDFTQPQLLAILSLGTYLGTTYREIADTLANWPAMRLVLGLNRTPDFTTLCKFARRATTPELIEEIGDQAIRRVIRFGRWMRRRRQRNRPDDGRCER